VLREGARVTGLGLLIGFPLALGLAVLLRGAIVGVSPFDPVVILLAPVSSSPPRRWRHTCPRAAARASRRSTR